MTDINELIGLPWKRGGRNPEEGFDCWGFLLWYYSKYTDIKIGYDFAILPGETKNIIRNAEKEIAKKRNWKQLKSPEENNAVALSRNSKIHHVGVWVGDGCLHVLEELGVVYNNRAQLNRNGYNKVEFYRWQG